MVAPVEPIVAEIPCVSRNSRVALRKPETASVAIGACSESRYSARYGYAAGALTSLALSLGCAQSFAARPRFPDLAAPASEALPGLRIVCGGDRS